MSTIENGYLILNNGVKVPQLGFGTFCSAPGEVGAAIKAAIATGYRHIDTAFVYGNEKEIGQALKEVFDEGKVKREDLFIVTKLWCTGHDPSEVRRHFEESRIRLQLDYVDMYLIHWPYAFQPVKDINIISPKDDKGGTLYADTPPLETWQAMEKLVDEGLIRSIGLSNFNGEQLKEIMEKGRIKPAVHQIEIHPYNSNEDMIKLCHSLGVAVTAYGPLASPGRPWGIPEDPVLLDEPIIAQLVEKYKKTKAQVLVKWSLQRNLMVIPKSVKVHRIQENFNVFDFEITSEDMALLNSMNRNLKLVIPYVVKDGKRVLESYDAPNYPFVI